MTTAPDSSAHEENGSEAGTSQHEGAPGAEIGISEEEGTTFEPEEDPQG